MGFFDKLGDIWGDFFEGDQHLSKSGEGWKNFGGGFVGATKSLWGGIFNLAMSANPFDSDGFGGNDWDTAKKSFGQFGSQWMLGATGGLQGVFSLPVIDEVANSALWLQNEAVKRPLGTFNLVVGDAVRYDDAAKFFDGSRWRQAYNDTRRVSTGQAVTYGYGQIPSLWSDDGEDEGFWSPDPRVNEGYGVYTSKEWTRYKMLSGGVDAMVDLFLDPTIFLGKAGKLAKVGLVSKPVTANAIERAASRGVSYGEAFSQSERADTLFNHARANSLENYIRTVYGGSREGWNAGVIQWTAANIVDPTRARTVFNDAMAQAMGDTAAGARLRADAPNIAQDIAMSHTAQEVRVAAARQWAGASRRADLDELYYGALRGDMEAAIADNVWGTLAGQIERGQGLWGSNADSLIGRYQPRVSFSGRWRAGVHESMATLAPRRQLLGVRLRDFMPSARYTPLIAVEHYASAPDFAASLERFTYLNPASRAQYLEEYARASSAESREAVMIRAQQRAVADTAAHYGMTPEQVQRFLPQMSQMLTRQHEFLNRSRRHMPAEIRRLAEQSLRDGRPDRAQALGTSARAAEQAIAQGVQPREVIHLLDGDGNPAYIANDYRFPSVDTPALQVPHAGRVIPMMDARALESALWWHSRGNFAQSSYRTMNSALALADAVSYAWKVGTLLRPGYMWRVLSDEVLRNIAHFGVHTVMLGSARGVGRAAANMWGRGGIVAEELGNALVPSRRSAAAARRGPNYDPNAPAGALPQAGTFDVRAAVDEYPSLQAMAANGNIGFRDWTDLVLRQVDDGVPVPPAVVPYINNFRSPHVNYSRADLERDLTDYALNRAGRGAFRSPSWQAAVADDLLPRSPISPGASRTRRPTRAEVLARGQAARDRIVTADPFTGQRRVVDALDDVDLRGTERLPVRHWGQTGDPGDLPGQVIYDYIHRHMDELTVPGSTLVAQLDNADNMMLSVGRNRAPAEGIPATGPRRLAVKVPFVPRVLTGNKIRYVRETGWNSPGYLVDPATGRRYNYAAAWDGPEGAAMRGRVSTGGGNAYVDNLSSVEYERLAIANRPRLRTYHHNDPEYAENWARIVNDEIAVDPAARMLLQGRSVDDVIQWVRNTRQGRTYLANMGVMQPRYMEQLYTLAALVERYVPVFVGREAEGAALRRAALSRTATTRDLNAAAGHADRMPAVMGAEADAALGNGAFQWFRRQVDKMFNYLGSLPADKAARYPFFAESYRRNINELGRAYLAGNPGRRVTQAEVDRLTSQARERALADVQKYLYESTSMLDMAKAGRLALPFGSAIADSYLKWGTLIREKPWIGYNIWKAYTAPDRAGLVQDQNGNHLAWENGHRVWYSENPKTGQQTRLPADYAPTSEFIVFRLPEGFGPLPEGMQYTESIPKEGLNTFLNWASTGPLVTVPVNQFTLNHPEFADNWAVKKFVLPYGPSRDWYRLAIPGTTRSAWEAFKEQDQDTATSQALAIYQAEMIEWSQGRRAAPPTYAEVREKAAGMRQMRFLSYFMGVSGQIETPYQPFADYYRQLQSIKRGPDDPTVDEQFYNEMGPEFFIFAARVSSTRAGIPATLEANKQWKEMQDLVATYPEIAGWLVGAEGGGEFNRAVYEAQFKQKLGPGSDNTIRKALSLEESIEDVQRRQGWLEYSRLMDDLDMRLRRRGLHAYTQKAAADLKKVKDKWVQEHRFTEQDGLRVVSPWYEDYQSTDLSKTLRVLNGLAQAAQDPRLQGRDDVRGLMQYLRLRESTRQMMAHFGAKTLTNKKVAWLDNRWNQNILRLKRTNLAFADLYNRYLERDNLTFDLSGREIAGVADESPFEFVTA